MSSEQQQLQRENKGVNLEDHHQFTHVHRCCGSMLNVDLALINYFTVLENAHSPYHTTTMPS